MNKAELISALMAKDGLTRAANSKAVNALLALCKDELLNGGKAILPSLGSLNVVEYKSRQFKNIVTGQMCETKSKKGLRFKSSASLRAAINAESEEA